MVNHERRGELAVNVERPTPDVLVTSGGVAYHVFCPIFPEKHVELLRPAFRRLFEIDSRFESVV
jgi:hypothetical protein